ncbi:MAG: Uma2 family endonuclease [Halanaerobiales bacterium]
MSANKKMITAQDLAEELDLSVETIWRYTREDKIPYIQLGNKQYRYILTDVIEALSNPVVMENKAKYETKKKKFTYQDYLELPEEPGYQYEVLEGDLIREPSPIVIHQRVSRRLQRILEDYFWEVDPDGEVFDAPLDVTLSDITVVQPDLFYVASNESKIIKEKRIDGVPTLLVEILSTYNPRKDRVQKMNIYKKVGVQHYWIVDPAEKTIECFARRNNTFALLVTGMDEDVVEHPDFPDMKIPLERLWNKPKLEND